ncbi:hypothetical protein HPB50_007004 [Hyalomma asiaticum]|uniref:Uncharacterized protein n=1 Tax=Hyalomma asiaticum TaxID=266040 RepID=A0ACB7SL52_HYAAI|nr:hypothetical protein HPB50_007004 [Hyalomma asiaticum]
MSDLSDLSDEPTSQIEDTDMDTTAVTTTRGTSYLRTEWSEYYVPSRRSRWDPRCSMNFRWRSLARGRETWRRGPARGLRIRERRCYSQHRLCKGEWGSDRVHCLRTGEIRGCLRLVVRWRDNLSDLFGKEIAKRVWETGGGLLIEWD